MACKCNSEAAPPRPHPGAGELRVVFERFWPAGLAFPPIAPYLGAAVTREQAYMWLRRLGPQHIEVSGGTPMAVLDFIGQSLMAGGSYRAERKKTKPKGPKKPDLPDLPPETPLDTEPKRIGYQYCGGNCSDPPCCQIVYSDGSKSECTPCRMV